MKTARSRSLPETLTTSNPLAQRKQIGADSYRRFLWLWRWWFLLF